MPIVMHWGIGVDSTIPVTGVLNTNAPEWFNDDITSDGIDLDYIEHCKECSNEEHDECYEEYEATYLIGYYWDTATEQYEIDDSAEYSAIVSVPYTQVTHSKYVSKSNLCSPCYPGQGDLDTPGEFLAFTLPPEIWGSTEHLEIIEIKEDDKIGEP